MTHKIALQQRLRQIVKISLSPLLHDAGFIKQGNTYVRERGQVHHVLSIQNDNFNTTQKISFTLSCGIYIPGVWQAFTNLPEPKRLTSSDCIIHVRPTFLIPGGKTWWEITSEDGIEQDAVIGAELRSVVENGIRQFFDRFQSEQALAEFLSSPRAKQDRNIFPHAEAYQRAYAAIIWRMLGEVKRSQECIEQAVLFSRNTPGKKVIDAFCLRFK